MKDNHIKILYMLTFSIVINSMLFLPKYSFSQSPKVHSLYEIETAIKMIDGDNKGHLRKAEIKLNKGLFEVGNFSTGDIIELNLFSERLVQAHIRRNNVDAMGTTIISGSIEGDIPGTLILTYQDNRLFATINMYENNRYFQIMASSSNENYYLVEIEAKPDTLECEVESVEGGYDFRFDTKFPENEK